MPILYNRRLNVLTAAGTKNSRAKSLLKDQSQLIFSQFLFFLFIYLFKQLFNVNS